MLKFSKECKYRIFNQRKAMEEYKEAVSELPKLEIKEAKTWV